MVNFTQQPNISEYQPSDNNIDFVFNSNQYAQPNFSFIVETWIDGAKVGTDKIYPQTNGYAKFDASVYAKNIARLWTDFNALVSNDRTYTLQLRVAERYGTPPITGTFANSSNVKVYKASLLNAESHSYPAYSDVLTRMRKYRLPNVLNFPFLVGFRYADGSHFQLRDNGSVIYQLNLDTMLTDGQLQFIDLAGYINNYTDKTDGEIDFQNGLIELEFDPCIKYVVMYVNKYGGFDYFSNIHNVTTSEDYTRYSYEQTTGVWNGNIFTRNYNQGDADYLNRFKGGGSIITNDIDDEDQNVVRDILRSTMTWIWTPDGFRRIKITNRDWSLNQLRFEDPMPMVINFHEVGFDSSVLGSMNTSSICAPADYVLKNTLATVLSNGSISAGASVDIIAPDGTAVVQYADGTPISTTVIPSGVSKTIPVSTPSGWYRPTEWMELPPAGVNEMNFLFSVYENSPNQIALSPTSTGGTVTVEFLQNASSIPFATYTTGLNSLSVNWVDCLPSSFFTARNYRQCIIRVKCVGGNLTGLNMAINHTTYGSGKLLNTLEASINTTNISSNISLGATSQLPYKLECVNYVGPSVSLSLAGTFMYCTNLKEVNIENTITANGSIRDAFQNCGLEYMPSNLVFSSINNIYEICRSSRMKIIDLDLNTVTTVGNTFLLSEAEEITLRNCQNITTSIGSFALSTLHKLILEKYKLSFTIANSLLFKEQAQLDLVNSLFDLTGSTAQNITMTGLTQYPSVTALANSKNWNIII